MKKLTAYLPDDAIPDLAEIAQHALKVELESGLADPKGFKKKKPPTVKSRRQLKANSSSRFVHPEGLRGKDIVMMKYRKNKRVSSQEIGDWLEEEGFARTTMNGVMTRLLKDGNVESHPDGGYVFVAPLQD